MSALLLNNQSFSDIRMQKVLMSFLYLLCCGCTLCFFALFVQRSRELFVCRSRWGALAANCIFEKCLLTSFCVLLIFSRNARWKSSLVYLNLSLSVDCSFTVAWRKHLQRFLHQTTQLCFFFCKAFGLERLFVNCSLFSFRQLQAGKITADRGNRAAEKDARGCWPRHR